MNGGPQVPWAAVLAFPALVLALHGWGGFLPVRDLPWRAAALLRGTAGFVALMHGGLALAAAGWLTAPVVWALTVAGAVLGAADLRRRRAELPLRRGALAGWTRGERALLGFLAVTAAVYFLRALPPGAEIDVIRYHQWHAGRIAETGRLEYLPGLFYFQMARGTTPAQAAATLLGGDALGRLLVVWLLVLAAGHLYTLARDAGRREALLAAAIGATLPLVKHMAGAAEDFLPACCLAAACTAAFLRHRESGRPRDAAFFVIAAAGLVSLKYTHLFFALPLLGALLAGEYRRRGPAAAAGWAAAFAAAAAPHYVRAWIVAGNPVFPFLTGLFGGRDWSPQNTAALLDVHRQIAFHDTTWRGGLALPYCLFFTDHYFYRTSSLPFIAALPGLACVPARTRWVLLAPFLCALVPWFYYGQHVRYLLPALLPLAAAAACLWGRTLRTEARAVRLAAAGLLVAGFAFELRSSVNEGWVQDKFRYLAGTIRHEAYLEDKIRFYRTCRFVNAAAPPDAVVLVFDSSWPANPYLRRVQVPEARFLQGWLDLEGTDDPDEQARRLRAKGVTWLITGTAPAPARYRALLERHAVEQFRHENEAAYELKP